MSLLYRDALAVALGRRDEPKCKRENLFHLNVQFFTKIGAFFLSKNKTRTIPTSGGQKKKN